MEDYMKVLSNGNEIEINDKLESGTRNHDIFPVNINLEDTIEFKPEDFVNDVDMSRIEIEKTIDLGGTNNG
jgi:hypothetical protein